MVWLIFSFCRKSFRDLNSSDRNSLSSCAYQLGSILTFDPSLFIRRSSKSLDLNTYPCAIETILHFKKYKYAKFAKGFYIKYKTSWQIKKKTEMKKLLFATVLIFALGVILSACSTHKDCPAYGKAKVEKVGEQA